MRILRDNSQTEKVIQQIEDILQDNHLCLQHGHNGFQIEDENGNIFYMRDIEDGQPVVSLPRETDSQRLVVLE